MSLFEEFLAIKKYHGATFFDTHVHPCEVFGFAKQQNKAIDYSSKITNPSLLEKMGFSNTALRILQYLFHHTPRYITSQIEKNYRHQGSLFLDHLAKKSGIDRMVLVPIYPHASPHDIYKNEVFNSKYLRLGSINFNLNVSDLIEDIKTQKDKYKICGIKLHSNLQTFYPNPEDNDPIIAKKLESIYAYAENEKLYLLFHGGRSFVPSSNKFVNKEYALPIHFIRAYRKSLSNLSIPIIIAHLGLYNLQNNNPRDLMPLMEYNNLYYDTAGVNPKHIYTFIKMYGAEKIIFGSDAQYFNIKHSITSILKILEKVNQKMFDVNILQIFGNTYERMILNQK